MGGFGLSRQHHPRYLSYAPEGSVLSIFDSARGPRDSDAKPASHGFPRGLIVLSWSTAGYLLPHAEDSELPMEAYFLKDRFSTYRACKFADWVGTP
ncbi:hypothetical protein DL765_002305 [Monosporascus sp. GIB2]|nr:hypothetical protein DL765_002305 [Monosporascus sp. GIB2]